MKMSYGTVCAFLLVSTAAVAGPCNPLKKVCQDAGFKAGESKKKNGLFADCVDLLLAGKHVSRVKETVSTKDFTACKESKKK